MNLSWYVPKANVDHTINGQGIAVSTLDHSATTPRANYIHKVLLHATIWSWPSSKGQKHQTKVTIKLIWDFDMENIPVKFQQIAYNSWVVIEFTR